MVLVLEPRVKSIAFFDAVKDATGIIALICLLALLALLGLFRLLGWSSSSSLRWRDLLSRLSRPVCLSFRASDH